MTTTTEATPVVQVLAPKWKNVQLRREPGEREEFTQQLDFRVKKASISPDDTLIAFNYLGSKRLEVYHSVTGLCESFDLDAQADDDDFGWVAPNVLVLQSGLDSSVAVRYRIPFRDKLWKQIGLLSTEAPMTTQSSTDLTLLFPKDESNSLFALLTTATYDARSEIIRVEIDGQGEAFIKRRWSVAPVPGFGHLARERSWSITDQHLFSLHPAAGLISRPISLSSSECLPSIILGGELNFTEMQTRNGVHFYFERTDGRFLHVKNNLLRENMIGPKPNVFQAQPPTTYPDGIVPILDSTYVISNREGRVLFLAPSIEEAIFNALPRGEADLLCKVNGFDDRLVGVIGFERALKDGNQASALRHIKELLLIISEESRGLALDQMRKVSFAIMTHSNLVSLNRTLVDAASTFLLQSLRQTKDDQIAVYYSKFRAALFISAQSTRESVKTGSGIEHSTRMPDSSTLLMKYVPGEAWTFSSSGDEILQKSTRREVAAKGGVDGVELQRLRRSINLTSWNRWSKLSDYKVALDAIEQMEIASACAFLRSRFEANKLKEKKLSNTIPTAATARKKLLSDSVVSIQSLRTMPGSACTENVFAYIFNACQHRALTLLCDYEKCSNLLFRVGIEPIQFYHKVALETYNRTLRGNVLMHLQSCCNFNLNDLDDSNEAKAEALLLRLERVYPGKSHAVALRRTWSSSLQEHSFIVSHQQNTHESDQIVVRRRWPPTCEMDLTTLRWRGVIVKEFSKEHVLVVDSEHQRAMDLERLKELEFVSKSDSRDGDDERSVEIVCLTCKPVAPGVVDVEQRNDDNRADPFLAFLRFSLRSIMQSDEETKWRVEMEADPSHVRSNPKLALRYLVDHNDWRGVQAWVEEHGSDSLTEWLRDSSSFASPLVRVVLKRSLLQSNGLSKGNADIERKLRAALSGATTGNISISRDRQLFQWLCEKQAVDAIDLLFPQSPSNRIELELFVEQCSVAELPQSILAFLYVSLYETAANNEDQVKFLYQAAAVSTFGCSNMHEVNFPSIVVSKYCRLAILALAPKLEAFEESCCSIVGAQPIREFVQSWPELLAACRAAGDASTISAADGNKTFEHPFSFQSASENVLSMSRILAKYFGMVHLVDEAPVVSPEQEDSVGTLRLLPFEQDLTLGPSYYLSHHRPVSAYQAFVRNNRSEQPLGESAILNPFQLAKAIAFTFTDDSKVLDACVQFLVLSQEPHAKVRMLKIDFQAYTTIMSSSQAVAGDDIDLHELFLSLSDGKGTLGQEEEEDDRERCLHIFRLLSDLVVVASTSTSGESDGFPLVNEDATRELHKLISQFCFSHNLPVYLSALDQMAKANDFVGILEEAERRGLDEKLFTDFLQSCSLQRSIADHVILGLISNLNGRSFSVNVGGKRIMDGEELLNILHSSSNSTTTISTTATLLLTKALSRKSSYLAAVATCFCEGQTVMTYELAWACWLICSLPLCFREKRYTSVDDAGVNILNVLRVCFQNFDVHKETRSITSRSAEAFEQISPHLSNLVKFRCSTFDINADAGIETPAFAAIFQEGDPDRKEFYVRELNHMLHEAPGIPCVIRMLRSLCSLNKDQTESPSDVVRPYQRLLAVLTYLCSECRLADDTVYQLIKWKGHNVKAAPVSETQMGPFLLQLESTVIQSLLLAQNFDVAYGLVKYLSSKKVLEEDVSNIVARIARIEFDAALASVDDRNLHPQVLDRCSQRLLEVECPAQTRAELMRSVLDIDDRIKVNSALRSRAAVLFMMHSNDPRVLLMRVAERLHLDISSLITNDAVDDGFVTDEAEAKVVDALLKCNDVSSALNLVQVLQSNRVKRGIELCVSSSALVLEDQISTPSNTLIGDGMRHFLHHCKANREFHKIGRFEQNLEFNDLVELWCKNDLEWIMTNFSTLFPLEILDDEEQFKNYVQGYLGILRSYLYQVKIGNRDSPPIRSLCGTISLLLGTRRLSLAARAVQNVEVNTIEAALLVWESCVMSRSKQACRMAYERLMKFCESGIATHQELLGLVRLACCSGSMSVPADVVERGIFAKVLVSGNISSLVSGLGELEAYDGIKWIRSALSKVFFSPVGRKETKFVDLIRLGKFFRLDLELARLLEDRGTILLSNKLLARQCLIESLRLYSQLEPGKKTVKEADESNAERVSKLLRTLQL